MFFKGLRLLFLAWRIRRRIRKSLVSGKIPFIKFEEGGFTFDFNNKQYQEQEETKEKS